MESPESGSADSTANGHGHGAATLARRVGDKLPYRSTVSRPEHAGLLESMWEQWKLDPAAVDASWQAFFSGFELGTQMAPELLHQRQKEASEKGGQVPQTPIPDFERTDELLAQARVYNLLFAYRTLGHYIASLDPLNFNKTELPELGHEYFKFTDADLDDYYDSGKLAGGGMRTLREIIQILRETYCGTVGAEYMHIQSFPIRRWVRDTLESSRGKPAFSVDKKKRILNHLLEAEGFEKFLHTRYVGQKRFSLEGGETLIPALDAIVEKCPQAGVSQIVMGMAHRGRLNVLANILGKDYRFLFNEFSENYVPETELGDGDVKYHMGYEASVTTGQGLRVGISLAPNPSHLEAVDPIVQGKARAWQRLLDDIDERRKVLPVLIHGDAAFAGQGVVMETLNLSQLEGYRTGGTLHIILNNQIGFTTMPQDARSTAYCTGVAKMLGVPIFHVNGDDPAATVYCIELALEFRQKFHRDVVVDIVCYRRHGHNEGDEPSFTQPHIYSALKAHPRASERMVRAMVEQGEITEDEAKAYHDRFESRLNEALNESRKQAKTFKPAIRRPTWCPGLYQTVDTTVSEEMLRKVGIAITAPPSIKINPKIQKLLDQRRSMVEGKEPVDWAMAEHLAFGTLLAQGIGVRLSGQDSRRGTFSNRHSVLYDLETRERYIPLKNISPDQARFCVYNSPLSEYAVLGFDFGYSLDYPHALIIWEAQFGDFVNGAQVIIDQYLATSETKWGITSNMVLLLPHGYEGQGPEHSSGRIERFLQLYAEDNIVVANCTTPANYFHILRRQMVRTVRKPLMIFTPKSLLRDPRCVSTLADFTQGRFSEILPDPQITENARRIVFCSGKVYYDLADFRNGHQIHDTAIIRMEQICPIHQESLAAILARHPHAERIVWCQEESSNMGARTFVTEQLRQITGKEIRYAGRDASASPATGSRAIHLLEQMDLVQQAFKV
jgi:2-oxoglutarate dehydrogenase E1 component